MIAKNEVADVKWTSTKHQLADILTKKSIYSPNVLKIMSEGQLDVEMVEKLF